MRLRALCTLLHISPAPREASPTRVAGSQKSTNMSYRVSLDRTFPLTDARGSTTLSELKNTGDSMLHMLWVGLEF
jgi:hypothetical protein